MGRIFGREPTEPHAHAADDAPPPLPGQTGSPPPSREPIAKLRLPNATGGKAYKAVVDGKDDLPDLRVSEVLGLEPTGLAFDAATQTLAGVARGTSDTQELALEARLVTTSGLVLEGCARLLLLINPDPRALWKELAPDPAAPFQKASQEARALAFGERLALGASVRGRSHAQVGSFREDDFALVPAGAWLVVAVSDGAGSAKLSREGSRLATHTASAALASAVAADSLIDATLSAFAAPPDEAALRTLHELAVAVLGRAAHAACKAINDAAAAASAEEKDFASTLLLAALRPCAGGTFVMSYWVGDGAIALWDADAPAIDILGDGDAGEFSGQTRFLLASELNKGWDEITRRVRTRVVPRFTALALMSDGVSDPKFATDKRLRDADAWRTFWADDLGPAVARRDDPELPQRLCEWLRFWSPGEHDDRTLALVY